MWLKKCGHKSLPWKRVDLTLARDKGWDLEQTQFSLVSLRLRPVSRSANSFCFIYMHIRRAPRTDWMLISSKLHLEFYTEKPSLFPWGTEVFPGAFLTLYMVTDMCQNNEGWERTPSPSTALVCLQSISYFYAAAAPDSLAQLTRKRRSTLISIHCKMPFLPAYVEYFLQFKTWCFEGGMDKS